jgi:hypothetical protein
VLSPHRNPRETALPKAEDLKHLLASSTNTPLGDEYTTPVRIHHSSTNTPLQYFPRQSASLPGLRHLPERPSNFPQRASRFSPFLTPPPFALHPSPSVALLLCWTANLDVDEGARLNLLPYFPESAFKHRTRSSMRSQRIHIVRSHQCPLQSKGTTTPSPQNHRDFNSGILAKFQRPRLEDAGIHNHF